MSKKTLDYAVIGLGRFGASLALRLTELGNSVLAVDSDARAVQALADQLDNVVQADATNENALRELGIEYFETAAVAIGDDFENNILVTSSLKELGVKRVVCKALNVRQQRILLKAGADQVLLPETEAGVRLADELNSRARELTRVELEPGCHLQEMTCPPLLVGRSLGSLNLRARLGVVVVAVRGCRVLVLPPPGEVLQSGDILLLAGPDANLARLEGFQP